MPQGVIRIDSKIYIVAVPKNSIEQRRVIIMQNENTENAGNMEKRN